MDIGKISAHDEITRSGARKGARKENGTRKLCEGEEREKV